MIIISAPSGAGKTTIVKQLLQAFPNLEFSVSACSRPMRAGEVDGRDYYFLSAGQFREKIDNGEFIEWEEVYEDHYYGTLKSELDRIWEKGNHVIFDVDVKGGMSIKKLFPENSLSVFIKAPSLEILEDRLRKRSTDNEESLKKRIGKAVFESGFEDQFDLIIVNDILEKAVSEAVSSVGRFLENKTDGK